MAKVEQRQDIETEIEIESEPKEPSMYSVIMLNDDITTMDFVVMVLRNVFSKSREEAIKIMFTIHHTGQGEAGRYAYDIAHSKQRKTTQLAKENGFPLRTILKEIK